MPDSHDSSSTEGRVIVAIAELSTKIETLIDKQEELAVNVSKIKEAVYNPDEGLYARLNKLDIRLLALESWKSNNTKATGLAHGFCIYATRLNIWRVASDGAWSLKGRRYTLLDINETARKTIGAFFSEALHEYLLKMTRAASVQRWNAGYITFGQEVRKVHVPLLGGSYNPEWIYRVLQVCRMNESPKIRRLHFTPSDLVVSLPGPDEKGNLRKLARILGGVKKATVQQLYDHAEYAPRCAPEFVSMVLCLATGSTFAAPDVSRFTGPCVACKEAQKGLEYCRLKKAHRQPSAPMKLKRKQTDSD